MIIDKWDYDKFIHNLLHRRKVKINKPLTDWQKKRYVKENAGNTKKIKAFIDGNGLYQKTIESDKTESVTSIVAYIEDFDNEFGDKEIRVDFLIDGKWLKKIDDVELNLRSLFPGYDFIEKGFAMENKRRNNNLYRYIFRFTMIENYRLKSECLDERGTISITKYEKWNYRRNAHLLIVGQTGSGKSFLTKGILDRLNQQSERNKILLVDPKKSFLMEMGKERGWECSETLAEHYELGKKVYEDYKYCEDNNLNNWDSKQDISENEDYFLVIDEFTELVADFEEEFGKKKADNFRKWVETLLAKGRSRGFHVIAIMQRPDIKGAFSGRARDNFSVKCGLGSMTPDGYRMVFPMSNIEFESQMDGNGYIANGDETNVKKFQVPWIIEE